MQKVREISRGGGDDGVEKEACNLTGNSGSDGQPVKMSEYWVMRICGGARTTSRAAQFWAL